MNRSQDEEQLEPVAAALIRRSVVVVRVVVRHILFGAHVQLVDKSEFRLALIEDALGDLQARGFVVRAARP